MEKTRTIRTWGSFLLLLLLLFVFLIWNVLAGSVKLHYDIGSARYRCFVQQHIAALQLPGGYFVNFPSFIVNEFGT